MCLLRLALIFCCGCMLSLIFIFTWHPLKEKIPGEQVSRGLLSWDCEKLFQFIPKEKLLLLTCVGRRILEKSSLECSSDGDGLIIFWATVEVEYLHLDIADDIANISSSLRNHMHHIAYLTLPPHIVNKPRISRENEKAVKIMTKT